MADSEETGGTSEGDSPTSEEEVVSKINIKAGVEAIRETITTIRDNPNRIGIRMDSKTDNLSSVGAGDPIGDQETEEEERGRM